MNSRDRTQHAVGGGVMSRTRISPEPQGTERRGKHWKFVFFNLSWLKGDAIEGGKGDGVGNENNGKNK